MSLTVPEPGETATVTSDLCALLRPAQNSPQSILLRVEYFLECGNDSRWPPTYKAGVLRSWSIKTCSGLDVWVGGGTESL